MTTLYDSLICYKQTELTHKNKIKFFLEQHSTKEGTWGQLILDSGEIDFVFLDGDGNELSRTHLNGTRNKIDFPPASLHKIIQISKEFSASLKFYCMPHRYFSKKHKFGNVHTDLLSVLNTYFTGSEKLNILDVGCGSGRNLLYLALQGHQVTGLDINSKALDYIDDIVIKEDLSNVITSSCDINNSLKLNDETYDLIVSTVCLQFLNPERIPSLLMELQQRTRSQGFNFLVFPINAKQFMLPESFTYLPEEDEIYHLYQNAGWGVLEYNETIGNLHRLDETGRPIQGKFGLILAQKF
jgi:tellurite methyltransferase